MGSAVNPTITTPDNFQPWPTIVPSVAILLTVLALNQLGEGLREALDPAGVSAHARLVRFYYSAG